MMNELRLEQDSLRVVADETGGFAVLNQNDFRDGFSRILEDNSSYYVLGYYPGNDKRDGRFRNVQVKVLRPGLKVRARRGYAAPLPAKKEKPAKNAAATSNPAAGFRLAMPNLLTLMVKSGGGSLQFTSPSWVSKATPPRNSAESAATRGVTFSVSSRTTGSTIAKLRSRSVQDPVGRSCCARIGPVC